MNRRSFLSTLASALISVVLARELGALVCECQRDDRPVFKEGDMVSTTLVRKDGDFVCHQGPWRINDKYNLIQLAMDDGYQITSQTLLPLL